MNDADKAVLIESLTKAKNWVTRPGGNIKGAFRLVSAVCTIIPVSSPKIPTPPPMQVITKGFGFSREHTKSEVAVESIGYAIKALKNNSVADASQHAEEARRNLGHLLPTEIRDARLTS